MLMLNVVLNDFVGPGRNKKEIGYCKNISNYGPLTREGIKSGTAELFKTGSIAILERRASEPL